jgi:hypothetical protein
MSPYCDCSVGHAIQVHFLGFTISVYLDFLFVSLGLNVRLSLFFFESSTDIRWFGLGYSPFLCF